MAVAKSIRSHKARGVLFREAMKVAKEIFRVSRESFWLLVAHWRSQANAKDVSLGIEMLGLGRDFVSLFMNEKGCLVAVLNSGVVFYAFDSCH